MNTETQDKPDSENPAAGEEHHQHHHYQRPFPLTLIATLIACFSLITLFLNLFFGIDEEFLNYEENHTPVILFNALLASIAFILIHNRNRWFVSRQQRLEYALDKVIRYDSRHYPKEVWVPIALDLALQILPQNSVLHLELSQRYDPDLIHDDDLEPLIQFLESIRSHIHLQPRTSDFHLLDEAALITAEGDNAESRINSFEIKRALYHSFAGSWPLRITVLILVFSLGLIGWKTFELAQLGSEASKAVEAAEKNIILAQTQLDQSKADLEKSREQLAEIVVDSNKTMSNAKQAVTEAELKLMEASKQGVEQVNTTAVNAMKTLERTLQAKSEQLEQQLSAEVQTHKDRIIERARIETNTYTELASSHTRALNELSQTTTDALTTHISTLQTHTTGLYSNHQGQLDAQTKILIGNLQSDVSGKTVGLNTEYNNAVGRLIKEENTARQGITAVFNRVRNSEIDLTEKFHKSLQDNQNTVTQLKTRVDELELQLQQTEARTQTRIIESKALAHEQIKKHEALTQEMINIVKLIEDKGSWAKPELLATLLEWRTLMLLGALLIALVSLIISGIVLFTLRNQ